jgi:KaiC/GvpD/RAD55 family RecA-like ATPase
MNNFPFNFGIHTLDSLICPDGTKSDPDSEIHPWTSAIQGPDGCGKSILALHLASTYRAAHPADEYSVIYISTDLSYHQALSQWTAFGLNEPKRRSEFLDRWYNLNQSRDTLHVPTLNEIEKSGGKVKLQLLNPVIVPPKKSKALPSAEVLLPNTLVENGETQNDTRAPEEPGEIALPLVADRGIDSIPMSIEEFLETPAAAEQVVFVDLQSTTAGDDWNWINQFMGLLPRKTGAEEKKHLIIIDAVEGLEMMVGKRDSFGSLRSRRSRIAQLIRNATAVGAHVVFVVEEPRKNARLPEQFVTDLVIRLRQHNSGDYLQRSVEIEKCRAIAHVRGEHEFSVRTGKGVSTGVDYHLDNPRVDWVNTGATAASPGSEIRTLAHVHVTRSLDRRNRVIREKAHAVPASEGKPDFGLSELDTCIHGCNVNSGSLTLVLGEAGTHKGRLGRRFLMNAFKWLDDGTDIDETNSGVAVLITTRLTDKERLITAMISHHAKKIDSAAQLMFDKTISSTSIVEDYLSKAADGELTDNRYNDEKERNEAIIAKQKEKLDEYKIEDAKGLDLRKEFLQKQVDYYRIYLVNKIKKILKTRVFCQRLGSRRLSSAPLGEIITTYLHAAQLILSGHESLVELFTENDVLKRREYGHRIRFVIEDWNVLLASHRELRDDPDLLQSIISLLRTEEINALVISTQPAQPNTPVSLSTDLPDLRSYDEMQVWTWPVMFYGQRRTAITVGSGEIRSDETSIFELIPNEHAVNARHDDGLSVNNHFDIYSDIEKGTPKRVPLIVRLYAGSHPHVTEDTNSLRFTQYLQDSLTQVFAASDVSHEVVRFDTYDHYDRFFTYALELTTARIDHTQILQIDEFWATEHECFSTLDSFWENEIVVGSHTPSSYTFTAREHYFCHNDTSGPELSPYVPTTELHNCENVVCQQIVEQNKKDFSEAKYKVVPIPKITSRSSESDPEAKQYPNAKHRKNFFIDWWNERSSEQIDKRIDRVPYLWDFGLLIADRDLWLKYSLEKLKTDVTPSNVKRVGNVWDALCLARSRIEPCINKWRSNHLKNRKLIDWPLFLSACRLIGDRERVAPFDVDLTTAESLTCIVLEMWASIQDQIGKDKENQWPLNKPNSGFTLQQLVAQYPISLYLALSELIYSTPHFESKKRNVSRRHETPQIVASRQWYHTASALFKVSNSNSRTILALPGSWSTRGDWTLAAVKGSRSKILAHYALDLLTSRRMNLLRLQEGLGLPVRDVLPDSQIGELPTAIYAENLHIKNPQTAAINYSEICFLGAAECHESNWLWRSRIKHFDRDSIYFRRWIARLIEEREWLPDSIEKNKTDWDDLRIMDEMISKDRSKAKSGIVLNPDNDTKICAWIKDKLAIISSALRST